MTKLEEQKILSNSSLIGRSSLVSPRSLRVLFCFRFFTLFTTQFFFICFPQFSVLFAMFERFLLANGNGHGKDFCSTLCTEQPSQNGSTPCTARCTPQPAAPYTQHPSEQCNVWIGNRPLAKSSHISQFFLHFSFVQLQFGFLSSHFPYRFTCLTCFSFTKTRSVNRFRPFFALQRFC